MKHPARRVVSTILTGDAIARSVETLYPVGTVAGCHLARRGFNHVYELLLADGRRCIARLSSLRARGAANLAYETALLAHLQRCGAAVAAPWPARSGKLFASLRSAEGTRGLAVFDFLPGNPPGESLPDIEAMGAGLASLHRLAASYRGPASRYQLTLPHLLLQPLQWLLLAPTLDAPMRAAFVALADRLERQIAALPALTMVACHGDCHGGNSFATAGADGAPLASFFDFDEAGPGYLSYDLAAYLWGLQIGLPTALDGDRLERWRHFVGGYRRVGALTDADFDAVAAFLRVRHFWFMGEYASRIHEWGSQALPETWLRKQIDLLTAWESLDTPAT